jgi:hypothetical protein
MQIPIIQKPAINARSRDSGARPLSVQVNPAPFMAEGEALAQSGRVVQGESQAWGKIQKQILTEKENTSAQSALKTATDKARVAVQGFDDPVKAEAEFKRLVAPTLKRITSGGYKLPNGEILSFSTGTSRRTFNAAASSIMSAEAATVRQLARERMASSHIANTNGRISEAVKNISAMPNGILREAAIELQIKAPLQQLERLGHLTAEQRYKETQRNVHSLARLQVEKLLTGASTSNQARQIFNDIGAGVYSDLSVTARQDLSERSQRLELSLERTSNAQYDRDQRLKKTQRETNQRHQYFTFYQRVKIDGNEKADGQRALSAEEVEKAYSKFQITEKQKNTLLDAIANKDAPLVEPGNVVSNYTTALRNALGKQEINDTLDRIFRDPRLKLDTKIRLQNYAVGEIAGTPEVKRGKLFYKTLENMSKPNSIIEKLLPGSEQKAQAILGMYNAEVLDGVKPIEAFQRAIDSLSEGRKANLNSMPKPRFALPDKPLKAYTSDDVRNVMQETKTKLKGKTSTLALELIYLETLERYVESDDPAIKKEREETIKRLMEAAKEVN